MQEYYAYLNAKAYGEYPLSFESWLLAALDSAERERDALRAALDSESLREQLAAIEHERWSGWMHYMFNRTAFNDDGTWTMPAWAVERWTRQMNTPYAELTEKEKGSDRAEVDKTLTAIRSVLYPPPHPPAPPSADWRAAVIDYLRAERDDFLGYAEDGNAPVNGVEIAAVVWDDTATNTAVVMFEDAVTDDARARTRQVAAGIVADKARFAHGAYVMLVVPEAAAQYVTDDMVFTFTWNGEQLAEVKPPAEGA